VLGTLKTYSANDAPTRAYLPRYAYRSILFGRSEP